MSNLVPGGAINPLETPGPIEPGGLFGREPELLQLSALLARDDVRLVTLTGPGGIGKTSLAIELAHRLEDASAPAVFVPLAGTRTTETALAEIATCLGIADDSDQSILDQIIARARDQSGLIVLDNLEQLPAFGATLAQMLDRAPGLSVLSTSRTPLRIRAEHLFPLSPLATGSEGRPGFPSPIRHVPAIALFFERARRVQPGLPDTDESAATIGEICRMLDGIPLAIELAAARCRLLPLTEILERLRSGRLTLDGGPLDLPERQRTMDRTVAWSYELLPASAQRAFRMLSSLDGFSLSVSRGFGVDECDLELLLEASLIIDSSDSIAARFRMLEPIRQVGLRMLTERKELDDARAALARWFLATASSIEEDLQGPAPAGRLNRARSGAGQPGDRHRLADSQP